MNSSSFPRLLLGVLLGLAVPMTSWGQDGKKPPRLVAPKTDPNQIYDAVSEPAEPVGGWSAYSMYLGDNLTYPTKALERKVQGTDSVQFVVEKNGSISGVTLVKGFDPECDAEALRVVKGGPKWKPARHRGEVVRQRVVLPVTFALPPGAAGPGNAGTEPAATNPPPGTPGAPPPSPAAAPTAPPPAAAGTVAGAGDGGGTTAGTTQPNGLKLIAPEVGAQPVGGTDAFFAWVQKNIQYPPAARRQKLEGKIRVEFMVEPDGSLTNIKVLNRLGGGLEQEAIRVIKSAPKWEPARYQGQAIRQKMVVPVIFQL